MAIKKGFSKAEGLTIEKLSGNVYREIALMRRSTSAVSPIYQKLSAILVDLFKKFENFQTFLLLISTFNIRT